MLIFIAILPSAKNRRLARLKIEMLPEQNYDINHSRSISC